MLARWFVNAGDQVGAYRLRKHGEDNFWRWVASWAICISSPDDIGFDGSKYDLPPLVVKEHVVDCKVPAGFLFQPSEAISATNVHREKRAALEERAIEVAKIVNGDDDFWAVWCDTDYEADALKKLIPDAIEVRGSHPIKMKEERLRMFSDGECRVIITKAEVGGFGLNWQHCHKTTWFAGYSYERWYQAVRRLWRFGQLSPVEAHVVRTDREESIVEAVRRKQEQHQDMQREMSGRMKDGMLEELGIGKTLRAYSPSMNVKIPNWLTTKVSDE
jgi:hypothetical protein